MRIRAHLLALLAAGLSATAAAQESIRLRFLDIQGNAHEVEGLLRTPRQGANGKAVVILHHAGGWRAGTTHQYGSFLERHGFVTLEVAMFEDKPENPQKHLAQVFGAVQYLSRQPQVDASQISVMGLSYGGALSLYSATAWAHATYQRSGPRLRSVAAFYPTCFFHEGLARGQPRMTSRLSGFGFPPDFYREWTRIPITILVGGRDDYESRDPKSCDAFVSALPDEEQRSRVTVRLYPDATHGWDHGRTYSFFEPLACKWQGCRNTNQADPDVTEKAKADLLDFLR